MKKLAEFKLRTINRIIQWLGFRLAVAFEVNDQGEIVPGPIKFHFQWYGWKEFQ